MDKIFKFVLTALIFVMSVSVKAQNLEACKTYANSIFGKTAVATANINGVNVTREHPHAFVTMLNVPGGVACNRGIYDGDIIFKTDDEITYKFDRPIKSLELWLLVMGRNTSFIRDEAIISVDCGNIQIEKVAGTDCTGIAQIGTNNVWVVQQGAASANNVTNVAVKITSDRFFTELKVKGIVNGGGGFYPAICPTSVENIFEKSVSMPEAICGNTKSILTSTPTIRSSFVGTLTYQWQVFNGTDWDNVGSGGTATSGQPIEYEITPEASLSGKKIRILYTYTDAMSCNTTTFSEETKVIDCIDTDGDGVLDHDDLDDDNDGILDTEENCDVDLGTDYTVAGSGAQYGKKLVLFDLGRAGSFIPSPFPLTPTSSLTRQNVFIDNTLTLRVGTTIYAKNNVNYRLNLDNLNIKRYGQGGVNPTLQSSVTQNFQSAHYGGSTRLQNTVRMKDYYNHTIFSGIRGLGINTRDIPNNAQRKNGLEISYDVKIEAISRDGIVSEAFEVVTFEADNVVLGKEFTKITSNLAPFRILEEIQANGTQPWANYININGTSAQVNESVDGTPLGLFINQGNAFSVHTHLREDGEQLLVFAVLPLCDTDGDGIPDQRDTDSDNDGCPDALEGSNPTLTADDLDTNGRIKGEVDENGVPKRAGIDKQNNPLVVGVVSQNDATSKIASKKEFVTGSIDSEIFCEGTTKELVIKKALGETTTDFKTITANGKLVREPDYATANAQKFKVSYQWEQWDAANNQWIDFTPTANLDITENYDAPTGITDFKLKVTDAPALLDGTKLRLTIYEGNKKVCSPTSEFVLNVKPCCETTPSLQFATSNQATMNGIKVTRATNAPNWTGVASFNACGGTLAATNQLWLEQGKGQKVTYTFEKPVKSAEVWLLGMGNFGSFDQAQITTNCGEIKLSKTNECTGLTTTITSNVVKGEGWGNVAVNVTSDKYFTELTITEQGSSGFGFFVELCPTSVVASKVLEATNPTRQEVCENSEVSFTSTPTLKDDFTGNISYQWQTFDGANWVDVDANSVVTGAPATSGTIASDETSTYKIKATSALNNTKYRVVYTYTDAKLCSPFVVNSEEATLKVNALPTSPTLTTQSFCTADSPKISTLKTKLGVASLNIYTSATATTSLADDTLLTATTYYVTQTGTNGCESSKASITVTLTNCITAASDKYSVTEPTTNTNAGNVLDSDKLTPTQQANDTNATITNVVLTSGQSGIVPTISSGGVVTVPAGTPAGVYTLTYKVCNKTYSTECVDGVTVTVEVLSPVSCSVIPVSQFPREVTATIERNGVKITREHTHAFYHSQTITGQGCLNGSYGGDYIGQTGQEITYKFDKPIKSIEVWLLLIGNLLTTPFVDEALISVNCGNIKMTKSFDCKGIAQVNGNSVKVVGGKPNQWDNLTNVAVRVTSDQYFTELTIRGNIQNGGGVLPQLCPDGLDRVVPLTITSPANQNNICEGQQVSLTSKATLMNSASGVITYQWQVSDDGTTWTNVDATSIITGTKPTFGNATSDEDITYTFKATSAHNGKKYRMVYTFDDNLACDNEIFTSNGATLSLGTPSVLPTGTDQTFCVSDNKKISDLITSITGENIKIYPLATGSQALNENDALVSGTYYATQTTANTCESNRLAIKVEVRSCEDTDGDGIADVDDEDDDNDGIPDNKENEYCEHQPLQNPTHLPNLTDLDKQLLFFDWGVPLAKGASASKVINGITYTITVDEATLLNGEAVPYNPTNSQGNGFGYFGKVYNLDEKIGFITDVADESKHSKMSFVFNVKAQKGTQVLSPSYYDIVFFDLEMTTDPDENYTLISNKNIQTAESFGTPWLEGIGSSTAQLKLTHYLGSMAFLSTNSHSLRVNVTKGDNLSTQGFGIALRLRCDTDGDGTPDIVDTDSDNDGCPDALEGDSTTITSEDIQNQKITGNVSADGIPVKVGAGQEKGTSLVATQLSFTKEPETPNQKVCKGEEVKFEAEAIIKKTSIFNNGVADYTAGETEPPVYQWQVQGANVTTWADLTDIVGTVEGVSTSTLTLKNVTDATNGNLYRLVVRSASTTCPLISDEVSFEVGDTTPPTITPPSEITLDCRDKDFDTKLQAWLKTATATDNCGVPTITNTWDTVKPADICSKTEINVGFIATDKEGNISTGTSKVKIVNIVANNDSFTTKSSPTADTKIKDASGNEVSIFKGTDGTTNNGADVFNGTTPTATSVTITPNATNDANFTIHSDGSITTKKGTPTGVYTLKYQICDKVTNICSNEASVTIEVKAEIQAVNDNKTTDENFKVKLEDANKNTPSILENDKLNGETPVANKVEIKPVAPATSIVVRDANGNVTDKITLNPNGDGSFIVDKSTPAGIYKAEYFICEKYDITDPKKPNTTNCSEEAVVTIEVESTILAKTDDFKNIPVTTTGGTLSKSVFEGDTLTGKVVDKTTVSVEITNDGGLTGVTIDADGKITIPKDTPVGEYTLEYQICEKDASGNKTTNCSKANVVVKVIDVVATIKAVDDDKSNTPINGKVGGNAGNILDNDTINTQNATTSNVKIKIDKVADAKTTGAPVPTINTTTGQIEIPAGTPAGIYEITYHLTDAVGSNPSQPAKVTVKVTVPDTNRDLSIVKIAVPSVENPRVGQKVKYTFKVTNTGTEKLTNLVLSDPIIGVTLTIADLEPTKGHDFDVDYAITQEDIDRGRIVNTAYVSATRPDGTRFSEPSDNDTPSTDEDGDGNKLNDPTITLLKIIDANDDAVKVTLDSSIDGKVPNFNVFANDKLHGNTFTGNEVTLTSTPVNGISINADGSVSIGEEVASGIYRLTYTICDKTLTTICDTAEVVIEVVNDCELVLYNALSVNGDGSNDVLQIKNIECYPDNIVRIFNRWGVEVFNTQKYDNASRVFEGFSTGRVTISKNLKLPQGTYYLILEYKLRNGESRRKGTWIYISPNDK